MSLSVVKTLRNKKGCRCRIKNLIVSTSSLVILAVVVLERFNQSRLSGETLQYLEMIVYKWCARISHHSFIDPLVTLLIIVNWAPHEMTLFNASSLFFIFNPVTSS
jgi:hypothetical protein